jgi:hypothetical protein
MTAAGASIRALSDGKGAAPLTAPLLRKKVFPCWRPRWEIRLCQLLDSACLWWNFRRLMGMRKHNPSAMTAEAKA